MPAFKIASGDLKQHPAAQARRARFGKPMIVSTGGGDMEDVDRAYDAILPINPQIGFLQCTAAYPAVTRRAGPRASSRPSRAAFPTS